MTHTCNMVYLDVFSTRIQEYWLSIGDVSKWIMKYE